MLHVQVAFQGGGARVSDLLTVVEKLQKFENVPLLKVNRVAGTSAGALAAAVAACGGNSAAAVKLYIQNNSADIIRGLVGYTTGEMKLWTLGNAWRVWRGEPIIDTVSLRSVLTRCFAEAWKAGLSAHNVDQKDPRWSKTSWTLGDIRKLSDRQLTIVAADIVRKKSVVYSDDEKDLIDALVDSSAIPFILRGYRSLAANPTVDGGLCDNMPSDTLLASQAQHGQVLAVSFLSKDTKANDVGRVPSNSLEFAGKVIETAVNSSVERALEKINQANIIRLESSNSTLDFAKAFVSGTRDKEAFISQQAELWLSTIVRSPAPPPPVGELFAQSAADIWQWYLRNQKSVKRRNLKSVMIARADCCKRNEFGVIEADSVSKEYHFAPIDDSVTMFQISIGSEWFFSSIDIDVIGPDGQSISFRKIPCMDKRNLAQERDNAVEHGYLLLFDSALQTLSPELLVQGKCYRVRARFKQQGGLSGLVTPASRFSDSISHRNRRAEEYESVEVIVKVPKETRLRAYAQWSDVEVNGELQDPHVASVIDQSELNDHADHEWRCYGWRVKNFPQGRLLKIDLHALSPQE